MALKSLVNLCVCGMLALAATSGGVLNSTFISSTRS